MKITKLTPLSQSEFDYSAEINLTKQQLEFITNVGLGVLLQAGAMQISFDNEANEIKFDTKDEEKDVATDIPSPAGIQE